jgi:hypothetical protein
LAPTPDQRTTNPRRLPNRSQKPEAAGGQASEGHIVAWNTYLPRLAVRAAGGDPGGRLGFDPRAGMTAQDWLATPYQRLAEITAGANLCSR